MQKSPFTGTISYWAHPGLRTPQNAKMTRINSIVAAGCTFFCFNDAELKSACRRRDLVDARNMIMYFMIVENRYTLNDIGAIFNRHHTTVIQARKSVEDQFCCNKSYKKQFENLSNYLYSEAFKFTTDRKAPKPIYPS